MIVVGTGLAGGSAAATLAEVGYRVKSYCYQDSPRRAHSIAAQGGINAAKNYRNDGDSIYRLFYDTVKGGDFRARESNVYRLAQVSVNIIDQCVAQGVPFAREYGGLLDNRSFGGTQVSRTFYARGQTGQQLLLGAYQAMERQIGAGQHRDERPARDARADRRGRPGPRHRRARPGHRRDHDRVRRRGRARLRRVRQRLLPLHQRQGLQRHRDLAGAPQGRAVRQPLLHPDPPDLHPGVRHPPVEAHADERVAAQRRPGVGARCRRGDTRAPGDIPEDERDYYLERIYPSFGNLVPRDIASRAAKNVCDEGRGVGPGGLGVYLDFADAIERLGRHAVEAKYGNLFEMYQRITGEDPYEVPMRIYPAVHYTMGGLWVDYDLQSTIPGLFVIGEANFSDHGANRLGASALMQGLADGYFVLPNTIGNYLAAGPFADDRRHATAVVEARAAGRGPDRSGCWRSTATGPSTPSTASSATSCGSTAGWSAPRRACQGDRADPRRCARSSGQRVKVPGTGEQLNQNLEKAGRVADFFELAELMCIDALHRARVVRRPLPGREPDPRRRGPAPRRRVRLRRRLGVRRPASKPILHKEQLDFEYVHPSTAELQVMDITGARLAPGRTRRPGPDGHLRRRRTSPPTCRSWRCSTSSTRS